VWRLSNEEGNFKEAKEGSETAWRSWGVACLTTLQVVRLWEKGSGEGLFWVVHSDKDSSFKV